MITEMRVLNALPLYAPDKELHYKKVKDFFRKKPGIWSYDRCATLTQILFKSKNLDLLVKSINSDFDEDDPRREIFVERLKEIDREFPVSDVSGVHHFDFRPLMAGGTKFVFPKTFVYVVKHEAFLFVPCFYKTCPLNSTQLGVLSALIKRYVLNTLVGEGLSPQFVSFTKGKIKLQPFADIPAISDDELQDVIDEMAEIYSVVEKTAPARPSNSKQQLDQYDLFRGDSDST